MHLYEILRLNFKIEILIVVDEVRNVEIVFQEDNFYEKVA